MSTSEKRLNEIEPARREEVRMRAGRLARFRVYIELLRARWSLLGALGVGALGLFVKLAAELRGGGLQQSDQHILDVIIAHRVPSWNSQVLELTAMGSGTVLVVIVVIALFFLWSARDIRGFLQLAIAGVGGSVCTNLLKRVLERERPPIAQRLTEVTSFSFPSGHSVASAAVYLTLALVLARRMPTRGAKIGVFAFALVLSLSIGLSRAYIGVHFPSD
ncbi:MAG: phosphatase PAP2 family protein, partial [Polyangiales bacterium]